MNHAFDPYYEWLSIPPDEQPPNHYRLLGLTILEDNLRVIANAADRQSMLVRTYQMGEHAEASHRILRDIATARVCLLDPAKKAEYDQHLVELLGYSTESAESAEPDAPAEDPYEPGAVPGPAVLDPVLSKTSTAFRRRSTKRVSILSIVCGVISIVVLAVLVTVLSRPTLRDIEDIRVGVGETVTIQMTEYHPTSWQGKVKYKLSKGYLGADLNPFTGTFTWSPKHPGHYTFEVAIVDKNNDERVWGRRPFSIHVTAGLRGYP